MTNMFDKYLKGTNETTSIELKENLQKPKEILGFTKSHHPFDFKSKRFKDLDFNDIRDRNERIMLFVDGDESDLICDDWVCEVLRKSKAYAEYEVVSMYEFEKETNVGKIIENLQRPRPMKIILKKIIEEDGNVGDDGETNG